MPSAAVVPASVVPSQEKLKTPAFCAPRFCTLTTLPLESLTVSVTESAALASLTPPTADLVVTSLPVESFAVLDESTSWEPATSTLLPIISADCTFWLLATLSIIELSVVLSLSIPVTVLICANWVVICALSIGLSGSWFCS